MGYFLSGFHGTDTILSDIVQMKKVEDLKDWLLFNYRLKKKKNPNTRNRILQSHSVALPKPLSITKYFWRV